MKNISIRELLVLVVTLTMVHALAASASIGVVTVGGDLRVDGSAVSGNATLFDGTSIETMAATGELSVGSTRVLMAGQSRGKVFQSRVQLERGKVQWEGGNGFRADAGVVQVSGRGVDSKVLVNRTADAVEVASLSGVVDVLDTGGKVLLSLNAGTAYSFAPDPQGASAGTNSNPTDPNNGGLNKKGGLTLGKKLLIGSVVVTSIAVPVTVLATRKSNTASR